MISELFSSSRAREEHIRAGRYLKDVIYAANDGVVTTFAVVAAAVGGSLPPVTILILGIANLFADGFSMASGNYLGSRSERDFYRKEETEEWREVAQRPEDERREVRDILAAKGYRGEDLDEMVRLVTSRKDYWIRFMMQEELQLSAPEQESAFKNGAVTFVSFVVAGSIPLLPYVLFGVNASFRSAAISTGAVLFAVGAMRFYFSRQSWFLLGLEMLVIGGSAAAIAYGIGFALRAVV